MLSEAHSVDTPPSCVTRCGAVSRPDGAPFGYGKESYVWAFIAALFTFVAGAGFSITHGSHDPARRGRRYARTRAGVSSPRYAAGRRDARLPAGDDVARFLRVTPDTTVKAVFLEDSAALIGLLLAAAGLGLAELTGDELWDGLASIAIGLLLLVVAGILARSQRLAAGRPGGAATGCTARSRDELRRDAHRRPASTTLLTMQLGPDDVLVAAKVDFADDATGADDRGGRRRGRAPAAGAATPAIRYVFLDPTRGRAGATTARAVDRSPPWCAGGQGRSRRYAARWRGAVELDVDVPTAARCARWPTRRWSARPSPATGCCSTSARSSMGLGTGGYALVVALPDRLPPDPPRRRTRDAGHLVKARYTPLQAIVLGVDEEASPHRAVLAAADDLDGMPVVTADLHSALPASWPASAPTARPPGWPT